MWLQVKHATIQTCNSFWADSVQTVPFQRSQRNNKEVAWQRPDWNTITYEFTIKLQTFLITSNEAAKKREHRLGVYRPSTMGEQFHRSDRCEWQLTRLELIYLLACKKLHVGLLVVIIWLELCTRDVNKDWTCKDKDKDKDQTYKDQDKD